MGASVTEFSLSTRDIALPPLLREVTGKASSVFDTGLPFDCTMGEDGVLEPITGETVNIVHQASPLLQAYLRLHPPASAFLSLLRQWWRY